MVACFRWLLVFSFGCQALASSSMDDDTVLSIQHTFSTLWRKKFNKGDVEYCGKAYAPDAALHVSFGPLAEAVKKQIFLPDPAILHGQGMIQPFWNGTQKVLGLKDMRAYEEEGEFASTAMVVNDDTVVVSSPFSFQSNLGEVKGQILSETWIRKDKEWKLQSSMITFQALAATKNEAAAKSSVTTPGATTTLRGVSTTLAADLNDTIVAADTGSKTAAAEGHGTFLGGLTILVVASIAAVMVRRAKNRRAAAISGFESMLG